MHIPVPLRRLYDLWMRFSQVLGRIMSTILLTILWIFVFGLYAIILKCMRLVSRQSSKETYWIDVSDHSTEMRYQF
ncbi:hypothetical protein FJZ27_04625 [Candidatus Peribacteria bacterium]|nr:hypothetical protein [Candidatus Peribacteria bacterium]